jgi:hypothetical protein
MNEQCQSTEYKIFDLEELASCFPDRMPTTVEGVRECVRILYSREYISVKYEDEKEICACPLSKGRLIFETRIAEEVARGRSERRQIIFATLGGFIGGIVSGLILLLLVKLGGG